MIFANPHILWLLLVLPPALLGFLWWAARHRQRLLGHFVQARLLPQLTAGLSPRLETIRAWLLAAAVAGLVLAIARPQYGYTWEEARQKGLDIVIAIDTSKSMLAEDIKPNRLARAKLAAEDLMQLAKSDRLGLVAFAGTAFLQCPLTIDDAAFLQSVDSLDTTIIPQGGTAIAEAITTAQAAFKEGDSHRILVLFTDGEDHDPNAVEAARKAAAAGMRIFTIGIGSAEGELLRAPNADGQSEYVRDESGNVVKSHLNEALLQEIASVGNGFYLPLRGAKVIETLYEKGLAPLPKSDSGAKLYKRYHEQFKWPLAVALLLLVIEVLLPARGGKRGILSAAPASRAPTTALIALFLILPLAATASPSGALRDYKAGHFDSAQKEYQRLFDGHTDDPRLALNAGTAAYRGGRLGEAESLLTKAVNAPDLKVQQEAYYNRGNTRFSVGDAATEMEAKKSAWERSLKDFEGAMKLDPHDADAKANYEFVKNKLEELKKQEQQQQQQQQQDKNQQQEKDQKQDQKDQQKQDQQQKQEQNKQEKQKSDQQKPPDKQDQQQQQSKAEDQQKKEQQKQDQQKQQPESKKPDQQKQGQQEKNDQKDSGTQPQQATAGQQQNQMTPDQAMRILDTTKEDEKMLPVQVDRPPPSNQKFKDW